MSLSTADSDSSDSSSDSDGGKAKGSSDADGSKLLSERVKPRKNLPPLLVALPDRKPEALDWIGVSYGVTLDLFNFWQR